MDWKKWCNARAETENDRKMSCWISPKGEWYNCPFSEHYTFAWAVIQDPYPAYAS